jgi:hypothetical protein
VDAMNGQIWFESEVNKGTTFHIRLLSERDPTKQRAPQLERQKVLIIEESETLGNFVADEMEKMNVEAKLLRRVEDAFPLLPSVELIIMDCNKFDLDQVKALCKEKTIINMSYKPLLEMPKDSTIFLKKPIHERTLMGAVYKFFKGKPSVYPELVPPIRYERILLAEDNLCNQRVFPISQ